MKKKLTGLIILLMIGAMAFVNFRLFFANSKYNLPPQETDPSVEWIDGYYSFIAAPFPRNWKFPFDKEWFKKEATEYNHLLAQSSLGMALSSFRIGNTDLIYQGNAIKDYLAEAHFHDIQAIQYDREPSVDTVATTMGWQQIDDFNLLAVSVCGGGYRNEWLSNFTIGDGVRHEGFNSASQEVQRRIWDYIKEHNLDPANLKIWISGFSRAAAISNITAADLIENEYFSEETIFNYNFACPRTTKEPETYRNIFNILGKNDYVPMVPFGEWGFQRYGIDLYLPAPESDSNYGKLVTGSDRVMQQLTSDTNWTNPGTNHILHLLMDFAISLVPDTNTYVTVLQEHLKNMWEYRSVTNLIDNIYEIMSSNDMLSSQNEEDLEMLQSYIISTLYQQMFVGKSDANWNFSMNLKHNLSREHFPDIYLAWMFSTNDPTELFTIDEVHAIITVEYDGPIDILDQNKNFLYRITPDDDVIRNVKDSYYNYDLKEEDVPLLYLMHSDTTTVIMLPLDQQYHIVLPHFDKKNSAVLTSIIYTNLHIRGRINDIYYYPPDTVQSSQHLDITPKYEDGTITFSSNTKTEPEKYEETLEYSFGVVSALLNNGKFISSASRFKISSIIFFTVCTIVALIGLIIVARRSGLASMFLLLGLIFATVQHVGFPLLPLRLLEKAMRLFGYLSIGSMAISCILRLIKNRNISGILSSVGTLFLTTCLCLYEIPEPLALPLACLGIAFIAASVVIGHNLSIWQWVVGGLLTAATIIIVIVGFNPGDAVVIISFAVLIISFIAMFTASFSHPFKMMINIWGLILSFILLFALTSYSVMLSTAPYALLFLCLGELTTGLWKEIDTYEYAKTS